MKITNPGPGAPNVARNIGGAEGADALVPSKENRRSNRAPKVETGISEKVAISDGAKQASKAQAVAKSTPDVDEAKVARLKAAIQAGSYNVDSDKIADRMVDEHLATAF